jgi:DNA-binding NtrC family response regulator
MRNGAFDYMHQALFRRPIAGHPQKGGGTSTSSSRSTSISSQDEEDESGFELLGQSPAMENLRQLIRKVARTQATVLIQGESGTGKELVARALYRESPRASAPFIKVNCAAIPENLIESEFFGHERAPSPAP